MSSKAKRPVKKSAIWSLKIKIKNNPYLVCNRDIHNARTIHKLILSHLNSYIRSLHKKSGENLYLLRWIYDKTSDVLKDDSEFKYDISVRIYWILTGRTNFVECPTCKNPIGYRSKKFFGQGGKPLSHCSPSCSSLDPNVQRKNMKTNMKKYGTKWPQQNREVRKKSENSYMKRYGVKHPMKSPEYRKYYIECLHRLFGDNISNVFQTDAVKKKSAAKCMERYGSSSGGGHQGFMKSLKKYSFDRQQFDSMPELSFYIWLKDNKIPFIYQPDIALKFKDINKKTRQYWPDFFLPEHGLIIEIKGDCWFSDPDNLKGPRYPYASKSMSKEEIDYLTANFKLKVKCMKDNNVMIFTSCIYDSFIEYVKFTRGKDFFKKHRRK